VQGEQKGDGLKYCDPPLHLLTHCQPGTLILPHATRSLFQAQLEFVNGMLSTCMCRSNGNLTQKLFEMPTFSPNKLFSVSIFLPVAPRFHNIPFPNEPLRLPH
jgi:hypothetical protein